MLKNIVNYHLFDPPGSWREKWKATSLSRQFALMSSAVLLVGMVVMGKWVSDKIETSVTLHSAVATALFMDSFVTPYVQELEKQQILSLENQVSLDAFLNQTSTGKQIDSFKIWKPGGLIAYSNRKNIIGKIYPETDNLRLAWQGHVAAEFDTLEDVEDAQERAANTPYLEIYSPVREKLTGRIIAVSEFYVEAGLLEQALFQTKLQSWLLVGFVTLVMLALLFGIVHRGSLTIDEQKLTLESRVRELSRLRNRLKNASRRSTEVNEHFLRRVGADLHDGPAQLLALALLRLGTLRNIFSIITGKEHSGKDDFEIIGNALNDALTDIRNISAGLVLPELDDLKLSEILIKATTAHELRTQTSVNLQLGELPPFASKSTQICLYRLIQEGLNNAFQHAPDASCSITADFDNNEIMLSVSDTGPGFDMEGNTVTSMGLGLVGLRDRIESLGGQFEIYSAIGKGTKLTAQLSHTDQEVADD